MDVCDISSRKGGAMFIPVMHQLPIAIQNKAKSYEWWRDDSDYFQYPVGLHAVSSLFSDPLKNLDIANKTYAENMNWREKKGFPPKDRAFLVGDSGGFLLFKHRQELQDGKSGFGYDSMSYEDMLQSLKARAAWVDPSKVLKWMEANCNIGFTLDLPPFGSMTKLGDLFKQSADFTYHNNKVFKEVRDDPDFRIYSVIHGDTIAELDYWWNMMEEFKFEGYAASCFSRGDAMSQAYILMYLYNKGVRKNVHLFGIGNINVIVMLSYISNWIENLTFDSFTIGQGLTYRTYKMLIHKVGLRFGDIFEEENGGLEALPCDCPVCRDVTIGEFNSEYGGYKMLLHNLYDTVRTTEFCNSLRKVPGALDGVARQICSSVNMGGEARSRDLDVIRSLEFIKCCIEEGFDSACSKYQLWLQTEDKLSAPHASTMSKSFKFKFKEKEEDKEEKRPKKGGVKKREVKRKSKSNFMDSIIQEEVKVSEIEDVPDCYKNFNPDECEEDFCERFVKCREESGGVNV